MLFKKKKKLLYNN